MNKTFIFVLLLSSLAIAHEEIRTPADVISGIMSKQGVVDAKQIDCSKVLNEDFEILGDAMMERMVGDHELHESIDAMMGGEGSTSLQSMHIAMGSNWLGCSKGMAAMSAGMIPMMMRMMGNYYPAYYSGYDIVLLLAIVGWVLFGASILYFYSKKPKRRR